MEDKQIVIDGQFVSERISQIVEAIRDYSPDLDVEYIPANVRRPDQAAFRIIHKPEDGLPYVIFHVSTEDEFDARVLKRIIAGDQRNEELTYSDVEAADLAAALIIKQKADDAREEAIDKMYAVFKSPLHTYKLDKDTIIKEGIPFNAKGY